MKYRILIVSANYYTDISNNLLKDAKTTLKNKAKYQVINVPGVFEIPVIIAKNIKKYHGFIALGCVIKGETPHFDLISKAFSLFCFFSVINGVSDSTGHAVMVAILKLLNISFDRIELFNSRARAIKCFLILSGN